MTRPAGSVLKDGRVLLVGTGSAPVLYDPADDTWSPTADPLRTKSQPVLAALADGRVLLTGSEDAHVAVFTPSAGSWSVTDRLPATTGQLVALPDGGALASGADPQRWDPTTGHWSPAVGRPDPASFASELVPLPDGRVFAARAGGRDPGYGLDITGGPQTSRVYDPDTRTWRNAGSDAAYSPDTGTGAVAVLPDGRVLRLAGQAVFSHDPGTDVWSRGGQLQDDYVSIRALPVAGGVLVIGQRVYESGPDRAELLPETVRPAAASERGLPAVGLQVLGGTSSGSGWNLLVAHLLAGDGWHIGTPVNGEPIELWRRATDGNDWSQVGVATTTATGLARFSPTTHGTYALHHRRHGTTGQAISEELELGVPDPRLAPTPFTGSAEAGEHEIRVATAPSGYNIVIVDTTTGQRYRGTTGGAAHDVVVRDLTESHVFRVTAYTSGPAGLYSLDLGSVRTEPGRRLNADPPAGGTVLCGELPLGETRISGLVRLCRAGAVVPRGGVLTFVGSTQVVASGAGGLVVRDGDLRSASTTSSQRVVLRPLSSEQRWAGVVASTAGVVDLRHVDVAGSRDALVVHRVRGRAYLEDVRINNATSSTLTVKESSFVAKDLVVSASDPGVVATCDFTCDQEVNGGHLYGTAGTALSIRGGTATVRGLTVTGVRRVGTSRGAEPSVVLEATAIDVAPRVLGSGGALDVVQLRNATVQHDLTWGGALSGGSELGWIASGVVVAAPARLTIPSGTFAAQGEGLEMADGAHLTVASGALLTSTNDPTLPLSLCASAAATSCTPSSHDWTGVHLLRAATADITGAVVRYAEKAVWLTGGYEHAPHVSITKTEIAFSARGVLAEATRPNPNVDTTDGSLTLTSTTLHGIVDQPLEIRDVRDVTLAGVTLHDTGPSIVSDRVDPDELRPTSTASITDLLAVRTGGLTIDFLDHPTLQRLTFRDTRATRLAGPLARPLTLTGSTFTLGPGGDLGQITGRGNPVDAVAVSGVLTASARWQSPVSGGMDDVPLGWVIGSAPLQLQDDVVLTLPSGAVLKSDPDGGLAVGGGTLDGTAGGAVLTGTGDTTVGPVTCLERCDRTWKGITQQRGRLAAGNPHVALTGARLRGGPLDLSTAHDEGVATLDLQDVDADGRVGGDRFARAVVHGGRAGSIVLSGVVSADVQGVTVRDRVDIGSDRTVLRDTSVTSGAFPGFRLSGGHTTLGHGQDVDGLTGAGRSATLALDGITVDNDVTWQTPTATGDVHPVGYVSWAATFDGDLEVPSGALVQAGTLTLSGGRLEVAEGSVLTGLNDPSVGPGVCRSGPAQADCGPNLRPLSVEKGGTAQLIGAEVRGLLWADQANLRMSQGFVSDVLLNSSTTSTFSEVTAHSFYAFNDSALHLDDVVIAPGGPYRQGILISGGTFTADRLDARSGKGDSSDYPGAVRMELSTASLTCADIEGNVGGLNTGIGTSLTVTDSALTGNRPAAGTYDLDNAGLVHTSGVWWGQPLGPLPGQVRQPTQLDDTSPGVLKPQCAGANPVAAVLPVRGVSATALPGGVRVFWAPATDPRVTGYRVSAGTEHVDVPTTASTTDVPGLPNGTGVRAVVTVLSALGDVPSTPSAMVIPAPAPLVTDLVAQPITGGNASAAGVSAHAPPGSRVTFAAGSDTSTVTVPESGVASTTLDLHDSADGNVVWTARAEDVAANVGPQVTTESERDTTAPAAPVLTVPAHTAWTDDTFTIAVQTEPGAQVTLNSATYSADESGHLDVVQRLANDPTPLTETATATDAFGNTSPSATATSTHQNPAAVFTAFSAGPDTVFTDGVVHASGATATPGPVTVTVHGTDGTAAQLQTTTASDGTFAVTLDATPAHDGLGSITATAVRNGVLGEAGNPNTPSSSLRVGPSVVRNLRVTRAGNNGFDLHWDAPVASSAHPVSGYGVAVSPGAGTVVVAGTSATVRGLPSDSDVELTVVARDVDVPGDPLRSQQKTSHPPNATIGALPSMTLAGSQAVTWKGTFGAARYRVRWRRTPLGTAQTSAYQYPPSWQGTTARSGSLSTDPGFSYCFSVAASDTTNASAGWSAERCLATALDDRALTPSDGWVRGTGAGLYRSTATAATRTRVDLTRNVSAQRLSLLATTCATCGAVSVYLAGTLVKTVSLVSSTTHRQVVIPIFASDTPRTGRLTVRTTSGKLVQIDGLLITAT